MTVQFEIPADAVRRMRSAGIAPFRNEWMSCANDRAAAAMGSRCHFYSADTLRYFGCRVSHVDVLFDGLVMAGVMSQKAGPNASDGREWRFAIHTCDGWTVDSEQASTGYASRAKAEKALADAVKRIKPRALFREVIKRKKDALAGELRELRAVKL